jgi:hypothetical protein
MSLMGEYLAKRVQQAQADYEYYVDIENKRKAEFKNDPFWYPHLALCRKARKLAKGRLEDATKRYEQFVATE